MKTKNSLARAISLYCSYQFELAYQNIFQKELEDSPFLNTGEKMEIQTKDFKVQIHAFDWNKEKDGFLHLTDKHNKDYLKITWYKHNLRSVEVESNKDLTEIFELFDEFILQWEEENDILI